MSFQKYYVKDNDLIQAEAIYRVVKWVIEDPDRAVNVASNLIGWGVAILGIACIASTLKGEPTRM